MDFANLTLDFSFVKSHEQLFGFLMVAGPLLSFLSMKFWIIARATAKAQHTTQWFVPDNLESGAKRIVLDRPSRSTAFTPRNHRDSASRP